MHGTIVLGSACANMASDQQAACVVTCLTATELQQDRISVRQKGTKSWRGGESIFLAALAKLCQAAWLTLY